MTKRVLLVLIVATVVATGAFAQFSMGGGIIVDYVDPATPVIDFEYDFGKVDLLWGTSFGFRQTTVHSSSTSNSWFGLYGGPAFEMFTADKWTVSIPLLAEFIVQNQSGGGDAVFGIYIAPGVRAKYAFNKNWSLYTGFEFDLFGFEKPNSNLTNITFFGSGTALLGLSYKFGK